MHHGHDRRATTHVASVVTHTPYGFLRYSIPSTQQVPALTYSHTLRLSLVSLFGVSVSPAHSWPSLGSYVLVLRQTSG